MGVRQLVSADAVAADADAVAADGADAHGRARRLRRWFVHHRWARRSALAVAGYVVMVVAAVVGMNGVILMSRWLGEDLTTEFGGVPNFRVVDDRVWAGGQPFDVDTYQRLASEGVTLVVDLRTGAGDDPREDLELLRSVGVGYVSLPVKDGHVPSDDAIDRFLEAVRGAQGVVFVHCGAGVGRTSALTAAYLRDTGRTPPVLGQFALGSHTLAQAWFVTTGDSNVVVERASEVLDAPRRAWSRLRSVAS
jgi:protein tyrosine phosphatase (PTP) superfamily phosphohydrolase (DUF442 family)